MNKEILGWKQRQYAQRMASGGAKKQEFADTAAARADQEKREKMRELEERREAEYAEREVWELKSWECDAVRETAKSWAARWDV